MTQNIIIFDTASGQCVGAATAQDGTVDLYKTDNNTVIETATLLDMGQFYLVAGVITQRPALTGFDKTSIAANGTDDATIKDLPNPCTVAVNGVDHVVTDGEFILSASTTGNMNVVIDCFPYLSFSEVITCA